MLTTASFSLDKINRSYLFLSSGTWRKADCREQRPWSQSCTHLREEGEGSKFPPKQRSDAEWKMTR